MQTTKTMLISFLSLVAFLVLARVIPHPPNFTPVLGMAIFAPFLFRDLFVAVALPLIAMLVSNLILGFHSSMFFVFLAIALITMVAHFAKMHAPTLVKTAGMVVASTFSFFVITNFAVWALDSLYPMSLEGLIACYIAAIPFYGNTIISTAIFSVLFLGMAKWVEKRNLLPALS